MRDERPNSKLFRTWEGRRQTGVTAANIPWLVNGTSLRPLRCSLRSSNRSDMKFRVPRWSGIPGPSSRTCDIDHVCDVLFVGAVRQEQLFSCVYLRPQGIALEMTQLKRNTHAAEGQLQRAHINYYSISTKISLGWSWRRSWNQLGTFFERNSFTFFETETSFMVILHNSWQ